MMTPLLIHEADKEIIGDWIKTLLEELDIEFLTLGSTTVAAAIRFKSLFCKPSSM